MYYAAEILNGRLQKFGIGILRFTSSPSSHLL